eukprot:2082919-Prymnesium_polylepis.2
MRDCFDEACDAHGRTRHPTRSELQWSAVLQKQIQKRKHHAWTKRASNRRKQPRGWECLRCASTRRQPSDDRAGIVTRSNDRTSELRRHWWRRQQVACSGRPAAQGARGAACDSGAGGQTAARGRSSPSARPRNSLPARPSSALPAPARGTSARRCRKWNTFCPRGRPPAGTVRHARCVRRRVARARPRTHRKRFAAGGRARGQLARACARRFSAQ